MCLKVKESVVIRLQVPSQYQSLGNEDKSYGNQMSLSSYVCSSVYKQNLYVNFLLNTKDFFPHYDICCQFFYICHPEVFNTYINIQ